MSHLLIICGRNFSGRSAVLRQRLIEQGAGTSFFIGPYSESSLSGLATNVKEEIALYRTALNELVIPDFFPLTLLDRPHQRLATLSGGEQVLLALYCFSGSKFGRLGIDTALEQLDSERRHKVLGYLDQLHTFQKTCILVDNRLPDWFSSSADCVQMGANNNFRLDIQDIPRYLQDREAPDIRLNNLSFAYRGGASVFENVSLSLKGRMAYRLRGPNGAGKTTLMKILCGVLPVRLDAFLIDDQPYQPYKDGNRLIALSMQNPDDQWTATTFRQDFQTRFRAAKVNGTTCSFELADLEGYLARFGVQRNEDHILDLPKALRKRLSWAWPLSGSMPWLAFDEPTLGQDRSAVDQLAVTLNTITGKGYGLLFISHDDDFASQLRHHELHLINKNILPNEVRNVV